uniref:PUM-HD domain-containing protein n=1 Tax=Noctiluca scintillans TaxID=2966 RepID=A0A7S1FIW1_NOCSC|mmetsp:Transcript_64509/g.170803  ORF Transcript_64509/g.170803 Transcript_64509/m.170803 type:complete len:368 (+) Transcript_64509:115-1218(+)
MVMEVSTELVHLRSPPETCMNLIVPLDRVTSKACEAQHCWDGSKTPHVGGSTTSRDSTHCGASRGSCSFMSDASPLDEDTSDVESSCSWTISGGESFQTARSRSSSLSNSLRESHRSILHKTGCDSDGQDTVRIGDALKGGVPTTQGSKSVLAMAQDKCGCSILIERVTGADSCVRQAILSDLLPMVAQWSRHPFAHQVVTTFLVTGSSVHCRQIAEKLSHEAASLSNDVYGCGVIELTLLTRVGRELIVEGLKDHVVECTMHHHGHHVIQRLVEVLPPSSLGFMVHALCQHGVKRVCRDKFGCRVIQRLLQCSSSEIIAPILDELQKCSDDLPAHQHGKSLSLRLAEERQFGARSRGHVFKRSESY